VTRAPLCVPMGEFMSVPTGHPKAPTCLLRSEANEVGVGVS
jgi:hypothetical protein